MKWRTTQVGDVRTVQRFAWLPVDLSNGQTIWLESYTTREKYFWLWTEGLWGSEERWQ